MSHVTDTLIQDLAEAFPGFDTDEPVNGADLVDFFSQRWSQLRASSPAALPDREKAIVSFIRSKYVVRESRGHEYVEAEINDLARTIMSLGPIGGGRGLTRSEEHTSELQSLMR